MYIPSLLHAAVGQGLFSCLLVELRRSITSWTPTYVLNSPFSRSAFKVQASGPFCSYLHPALIYVCIGYYKQEEMTFTSFGHGSWLLASPRTDFDVTYIYVSCRSGDSEEKVGSGHTCRVPVDRNDVAIASHHARIFGSRESDRRYILVHCFSVPDAYVQRGSTRLVNLRPAGVLLRVQEVRGKCSRYICRSQKYHHKLAETDWGKYVR